jgi:hypothetical protein
MGAASRLISRDALSHVRRKYRRYTCGTDAPLEEEAVQSLAQGSNRLQPPSGNDSVVDSAAAAAGQFRLVSDRVRNDLQQSFNQRLGQRQGVRSTAVVPFSADGGAHVVTAGTPLLIPLAPSAVPTALPGDFAVRAHLPR